MESISSCDNSDDCKNIVTSASTDILIVPEFHLILVKKHIHKITLELHDDLILPNKQVKYMKSNKKYWWIKKNYIGGHVKFIEIENIEGNKKFKMDLELERGSYTIGCGTHNNGIRKDFRVSNDDHIFIK